MNLHNPKRIFSTVYKYLLNEENLFSFISILTKNIDFWPE